MSIELENNIEVYDNTELPTSNDLIKSVGKQSLLANKILLIALSKVEMRNGNVTDIYSTRYNEYMKMGFDLTKGLVSEIPLVDITRIRDGKKSGSLYKYLEELFKSETRGEESYKTMKGMFNILIKNEKTGILASVNLIQLTLYDKVAKKLYIKFTDEPIVRKNIIELKNNYTLLPKNIMLSFKSNYTFKLFEILKSDFDRANAIRKKNNEAPLNAMKIRYNIAELKFKMGVLGIENSEISSALQERNPMYDEIEDIMVKQNLSAMPRYADFKRYALDKAKEELHEKTNMDIDYEPVRLGKGGKVVAIDIYIERRNNDGVKPKVLTEAQKLDFIQDVLDMIDEKIKVVDAKNIAEAAEYDIERIDEAYNILKSSKTKIDNVVGFMLKAINGKYTKTSAKTYKTKFHQYEQNDYDFEELEKKLLAR